jgi:hypothetical protein
MGKHTYQHLGLHVMAVVLCTLCLLSAALPGREAMYFPAGLLALVAFGTGKDFVTQALNELRTN